MHIGAETVIEARRRATHQQTTTRSTISPQDSAEFATRIHSTLFRKYHSSIVYPA
jgi:hypothetical protein